MKTNAVTGGGFVYCSSSMRQRGCVSGEWQWWQSLAESRIDTDDVGGSEWSNK